MEEPTTEVPVSSVAAGTLLGRYEVRRLIGQGGMATVYEGVHAAMGKRVAIKIIDPGLASMPGARARFIQEAQLTARVRHPHIVDVSDVGATDGHVFLVMEYLEGEDLAALIKRRGPLPVAEVASIVLPVVAAVAAAHDEGIVHCDLKPSNIFLTRMRDGSLHPKVVDFGISRAIADAQAPRPGENDGQGGSEPPLVGSPTYLAPEQVRDTRTVSPAGDQYALGLILYECLTGRVPYQGPELRAILFQILTAQYPPVAHHRPDLPPALQRLIGRAMSLDPTERFASVTELGGALLAFAPPAARMTWYRTFGRVMSPRARAGVSPVPVTVETPGRSPAGPSVTVAIPGTEWLPPPGPAPVVADVPPAADVPPVADVSPPLVDEQPADAVPRSHGHWVVASLALVVAGALVTIAFRGGARGPTPASARAATTAAVARPQTSLDTHAAARPSPPPPAVAEPRTVPEPGEAAAAAPEAAPASSPAPRASGRSRSAGRRPQAPAVISFGRNGAPLIE